MSPKTKTARPVIQQVEEVTVRVRVLPDGRMTAKDAAAYLGVEAQTAAEWRWRGVGPRWIKMAGKGKGGRIFYFKRDLDAYLAAARRRRTSTSISEFHAE
jgi:hypothetical protein